MKKLVLFLAIALFFTCLVCPSFAQKSLNQGWTWFSVNVEGSDMSIGTVLGSLSLEDGDYIKNQTVSATYYDGVGWFGDLVNIDPMEMYKMKKAQVDLLNFEGPPVNLCTPIQTQSGWSWIGFLPQTALPIDGALASLNPVEGDYIKNQEVSATYYDAFGWFGELTDLIPLEGYMLKTSHPEALEYPGCDEEGTFVDSRDSHTYKWLKIGDQTWMAENLAWLPSVSPPTTVSSDDPYYYVYGYEGTVLAEAKATDNYNTYGVLYNWEASIIACPDGWHFPSDEEWKTLEVFLGMSPSNADAINWRTSGAVGMKLKSSTGWYDNGNGDNSSGLNCIPGGYLYEDGFFNYLSKGASFWTSTPWGSYAWSRSVQYYNITGVSRSSYSSQSNGYSIRCVKNVPPEVSSIEILELSPTVIATGGNVTFDGGSPVLQRGMCWSSSENPDIDDNITIDGSGTGSFESLITGLEPGTVYHVRAYATSSIGTSYGENVSFMKLVPLFTDSRDGNSYEYIILGTQTWMSENLAWLPAVSTSDIGSDFSSHYYVYGYEGTEVPSAKLNGHYGIYGVLYNWNAAMTACPSGWHLPSLAEWTTLLAYLHQNGYGYEGSGADIGKSMASPHYWDISPTAGHVGNDKPANNSSEFNAIPAGNRMSIGGFSSIRAETRFWSSTTSGSSEAWFSYLLFDNDHLQQNHNKTRSTGFSVRCLKD